MTDNSSINKFKCYLCPAKSYMKDEGVKCSKCTARYHKACAKRANKQSDGSYVSCCGKSSQSTSNNNLSPDVMNEGLNSDEFKQFAPLWAVLKPYLDSYTSSFQKIDSEINKHSKMFADMVDRIDENDERIDAITDELHQLRDQICNNDPLRDQRIIQEMVEQKKRESNFLLFNFQDSKEAYKSDTKSIKELLGKLKSNEIPFNKNNIKTKRMGKYADGNCRPLLVELSDKEHVHWFFNNKKKIFDDAVRLSSDFTKSQRECYNIVNQERKKRIKDGEKDLVIKTVNGFPTIVSIKKGTEKSNASDQPKN